MRRSDLSPRLTVASLDRLPAGVRRPSATVLNGRPGIVHLGIGAFHRAHQAVFTEDAMDASGSGDWGIVGVTQRSPTVRDQLRPQGGLFTLLQRGAGAAGPRVVGAVRDVLFAAEQQDDVAALIADPAVHVLTMTVSEKGYRRGDDGHLDLDDPVVRADLAAGTVPRSVAGQVVHGLARRARDDAGPLTILCCDNLTGNGTVVRGLVEDFVAAMPTAAAQSLGQWLTESVRFPSSMVDRIVPATTDDDRRQVRDQLGVDDRGVVVAEPFSQWVVEDNFAGDRPPWEHVGVTLTADVAPWEKVKLRLLNGSHSLIAYLGAVRGHATVSGALQDDVVAAAVRRLMADVVPTLDPVEGLDVDDYAAQVLSRFGNASIRYLTTQVAGDGSQKLPQRVLGTIRDSLAADVLPEGATMAVAAWMAYVRASAQGDPRLPLNDPLAGVLREAVSAAGGTAGQVDALLAVRQVFGLDLPDQARWRDLLVEQLDHVWELREAQ